MFVTGVCEKHTSRDNKIPRTESRCIYQYITHISKYFLSYYFSKDFLNSRKSQVVCTLRERPFNLKGGGGLCFFSKKMF